MTGSDALLDALSEQGVQAIFGNPGATELPIVESLAAPGRPRFVLGLTEPVVMGMADGYSQASGRMSAVLVHVQPGLANALSGVLNAARARVPMLVIVGQQMQELLPGAPFLGGDVIGMARPIARFAEEVSHIHDLGDVLARAVMAAYGPPAGPAVVSIPLDIQSAACGPLPSLPRGPVDLGPGGNAELDAASGLLARAARPVIIAGDSVADGGAGQSLSALAARLGAPIWGEPFGARLPVDTGDPAWRGTLPRFGSAIHDALAGHDVVLALGMPVFRVFGWSPGPTMPEGAALIHVDLDPVEIGRMVHPAVGITANPGAAIHGLLARLGLPERAATQRAEAVGHDIARMRSAVVEGIRAAACADSGGGITGSALSVAIAEAIGPGDLIIDEGLTATRHMRPMLGPRAPGSCLWHRGSALGWGLPAAVGARIADPTRRVVVVQGDGSLMFGVQAIWSAAREGAPVALVVADNGGYEVLEDGMRALTGTDRRDWPGLHLTNPRMDIAGICRGFGATAERVWMPADLSGAMDDLLVRVQTGVAVLVAEVAPGA